MAYLNEVFKGQTYTIDGEEFKITEIRATNVVSSSDYVIAVTFQNENKTFDTNIEKVIKGDDYKLIS
ncbi:hypothetical protein [Winogradskyella luteola]|uniref:Uncharacterized protein n=1 Tax=Winogradskyella luteola TaxID=2828330 RepID=A0A9X1JMF1_9FLAO|nr:hypothetical protein [Winogradskyella luteola]MBV7268390.1 hypothetical protein [Winogradskyella luteola]